MLIFKNKLNKYAVYIIHLSDLIWILIYVLIKESFTLLEGSNFKLFILLTTNQNLYEPFYILLKY